jgi:hypothetical protein
MSGGSSPYPAVFLILLFAALIIGRCARQPRVRPYESCREPAETGRPDRGQSGAGKRRWWGRAGIQWLLQSSVSDIVKRQRQIGITVSNDGEFGKSMGHPSTTERGSVTSSIGWMASRSRPAAHRTRRRARRVLTSSFQPICPSGAIGRNSCALTRIPTSRSRQVRDVR